MTDDRADRSARGRDTGSREESTEGPADRDAQDSTIDGTSRGNASGAGGDVEVVDLQLLLEQIAASAGDPPEHGLAGVAARRRRRKRHRRGAVATAMTLAVAATLTAPFLLRDDDHDVTADSAAAGTPKHTELPDTVQLVCAPSGIDVPVASIRPRDDGLHIDVFNGLASTTRVWVRAVAEDDPDEPLWDSGPIYVDRGRQELIQPVPPGVLTIGCRIGGVEQQRQVELVDVDGHYDDPELACDAGDDDEPVTLADVAVPENASGEPARSYVVATRAALRPLTLWDDGDVGVTEPEGYPRQSFGSWSYQPMTEVVQDGDVVALVSLGGDDEAAPASAPWTRAPEVDVCRGFLNEAGLALTGS